MKFARYILFLLILSGFRLAAQKSIQITKETFGRVKIYDIYTGELLEYKLKGDFFFRKDRIANLQDTIVLFENDNVITLNEIREVRFRKHNHLVGTFQGAFWIFGGGFISLSILNNTINDNPPIFNTKALYVTASLAVAGLLMRQINLKHLHMTKNKTIKIVDRNYQDLNKKSPEVSSEKQE